MNPRTALLMTVAAALRQGSVTMARATSVALFNAQKSANGEGFAESDPELPKIETRAVVGLLALWADLRAGTFAALGLTDPGSSKAMKADEPAFAFDALASLRQLMLLQERFIAAAGAENGPLVQQAYAAWVRGVANAAAEVGSDAVIDAARRAFRAQIQARGLQLVRDGVVRTFAQGIVAQLTSGELDDLSPRDVARKLRERFDAGDYNWERLARSETAMAQVDGKREQYLANGVERVDYITARDSKVSAICRGLAAAGPYDVATAPVPVRNSHPNCRCSWRPVLD